MKLWKENKLNQEWIKEDNEILEEFKRSKYFRQDDCGIFYEDQRLTAFITSKDGLNSTFDLIDFDNLWDKWVKVR